MVTSERLAWSLRRGGGYGWRLLPHGFTGSGGFCARRVRAKAANSGAGGSRPAGGLRAT